MGRTVGLVPCPGGPQDVLYMDWWSVVMLPGGAGLEAKLSSGAEVWIGSPALVGHILRSAAARSLCFYIPRG